MKSQEWDDVWVGRTVDQEIQMRDFYSGRQYILKYLPRNGINLEAGSGLGRYVFYLSDLGFNIIGIDVSLQGLNSCKNWAGVNGYNNRFICADIRTIPLADNSISGYISLGVIEHFKEGPEYTLKEANRILKDGGIAIISTPNRYSFHTIFLSQINKIKLLIKFLLSILRLYKPKVSQELIFQYEYSAKELIDFVRNADFEIIDYATISLKYPVYALFRTLNKLRLLKEIKGFLFPFLDFLEQTPLRVFGGLSLVVAYKKAKIVECFFCSKLTIPNSQFSVPVCKECSKNISSVILNKYKKGKEALFHTHTLSLSEQQTTEKCFFCGRKYIRNKCFRNYGFSVSVCPDCKKDPKVNIKLANFYLKEVWREYN